MKKVVGVLLIVAILCASVGIGYNYIRGNSNTPGNIIDNTDDISSIEAVIPEVELDYEVLALKPATDVDYFRNVSSYDFSDRINDSYVDEIDGKETKVEIISNVVTISYDNKDYTINAISNPISVRIVHTTSKGGYCIFYVLSGTGNIYLVDTLSNDYSNADKSIVLLNIDNAREMAIVDSFYDISYNKGTNATIFSRTGNLKLLVKEFDSNFIETEYLNRYFLTNYDSKKELFLTNNDYYYSYSDNKLSKIKFNYLVYDGNTPNVTSVFAVKDEEKVIIISDKKEILYYNMDSSDYVLKKYSEKLISKINYVSGENPYVKVTYADGRIENFIVDIQLNKPFINNIIE